MNMTQANVRRRKLVIGTATFGALVSAGGFLWVDSVAATRMDPFGRSGWAGASIDPGLAAFVVGSLVLLAALITIRRHVHPRIGGRMIWVSVWLVLAAIALDCFGTATRVANPFSGIGAFVEVMSFAVGFLTEVVLVSGVASVVLRRVDGVRPATAEPGGRRRHIFVGVATGFAILSGLLAAMGYFTVAALEQDYTNDADVSHWNAAAIDAGVAEFIVGSVILLAALLTIRLQLRPRAGARFIWASAWLFWAAVALNCLGLALATDPRSASDSSLVLLSLVVEVPAVVLLLFGLRLLLARSGARRRSATTATDEIAQQSVK
jgi:hypothetical protein